MSGKLKLDFSIGNYPHTKRLLSGEIEIDGIEPNFIEVKPQIGAYRRMVRDHEFDVCEIAPTTYIIARGYGAPFVGLPIFLMRQFNHGTLLVRPDAGIKHPKDLEGHKVGVRAYSVTTGVWLRSALVEDFGLDDSKVTWVVDDEEHVVEMKLPDNVVHAPEGRSLNAMMADGELVAGFAGNAGVGRTGSPTGGWKVVKTDYPKLFPNDGGAYLMPQILVDVDHSMRIMREESFGPVVGIMKVKDDDEAIALMNDSDFGLTVSLWTNDSARAERIAHRLQTGTVFMNRCDYLDPALCWTGCKDTGRGGSLSVIAFHNLTRPMPSPSKNW